MCGVATATTPVEALLALFTFMQTHLACRLGSVRFRAAICRTPLLSSLTGRGPRFKLVQSAPVLPLNSWSCALGGAAFHPPQCPCAASAPCRTVDKIASAYYYDVKDAAGALVITNQLAGIADVTQNTLQFTTATISQGSQRYSVTVRACTGQATKCSSGADSNLAGIGEGAELAVHASPVLPGSCLCKNGQCATM